MSMRLWRKKDDIGSDGFAERESRVLWRGLLGVILAHNETVRRLSPSTLKKRVSHKRTNNTYDVAVMIYWRRLLQPTIESFPSGEVHHSMQYHSYVACHLSLFGGERRSRTLLREMYGDTVISAAIMLCNPLSRPYIIYDTENRPNLYRY